jgi:hypothetical protein
MTEMILIVRGMISFHNKIYTYKYTREHPAAQCLQYKHMYINIYSFMYFIMYICLT